MSGVCAEQQEGSVARTVTALESHLGARWWQALQAIVPTLTLTLSQMESPARRQAEEELF